MSAYKDLEDYGIIGNLKTCALIGRDGSIDWLCLPYLESPSVFAALLDIEKGGHFKINPTAKYESFQSYIENTNILQTTFTTPLGSVVITDFMDPDGGKDNIYTKAIFRKVECIKGRVELEVDFQPRFDYAKKLPIFELIEEGVIARWKNESLSLQSPISLKIHAQEAKGVMSLNGGETAWFILHYNHCVFLPPSSCEDLLRKVERFWLNWVHRCLPSGCILNEPLYGLVVRSALVLKLLSNPESGAIAAAPTTSLPEHIGGARNWDYRYAWIRDASFTSQALFHSGHSKESQDFRRYMEKILSKTKDPSLIRIMYGLNGEVDLEERILENLSGYKNSNPVRIGNGAAKQRQLDIYGELLNSIYDTTRYGETVSNKDWKFIKRIVDYVCLVWNEKDSGIWEVRGEARHFVYSKLMCWVAVDRAIKISNSRGFKAPLKRWEKVREIIKQTILEKGYSKKLNSFVQAFDSEYLDATSLLIPFMGLLPFDDKRILGTIDAIVKKLATKEGLVYRYESDDGLRGPEGYFILCSFWLIKALALSGKRKQAKEMLLNVLKHISPLGLFAEEIDPKTGKQLGNFPQAFSHVGLINSILYLGIAKGKEHEGPDPIGMS